MYLLIVTGCSFEISDEWISEEPRTADTSSSKTDALQSGRKKGSGDNSTHTKPAAKKVDNPILAQARQNNRFDAREWIRSDYTFLKSPNPSRISPYDDIIKKMALRYGFDWRLIAAQIFTESNFRDRAQSHAGAVGLMQIMPSTAKFLGINPATIREPEINIAVGCMYNQRMYSLWGRQTKDRYQRKAFALASYNAGRGRVLRSYQKAYPPTWKHAHLSLPGETQDYVHKIHLKYDFYKNYFLP